MSGQFVRYLLAGGVNTAISYGIYLGLLGPLGYRMAYPLAFVAGIGLSFLLLRHWVFARAGRRFSLGLVALGHGAQLALGWVVVEVWVAWLHMPDALAPLAAIVVCVPLMFALQRWVFSSHAG
ncbi:MAG: GtrA family protein [Pseudomonadota bacterium]|nr:GtrA family protein [Pseudomonadota bacterium]